MSISDKCYGQAHGLARCDRPCTRDKECPRLDQDPAVRVVSHGDVLCLQEHAAERLAELADRQLMHALRALRLWHWRHALAATYKKQDGRASPHTVTLAKQSHAFHMHAVIALNDLFPIGDTAEQDDVPENANLEVLAFRVPG